MKILITTDLFTVRTNGVVTSTHNLIAELRARGHEVKVITFSENGRSRKDGDVYYVASVSMEWIYPNLRFSLIRANKFVKEIVEWHPDVIHSQCEWFSMGFAKRIAKKTGAPIVHTYHTLYEDYVGYAIPFKRFGKWFVREIVTRKNLKKVAAIIAPTAKVKDNLINNCGVKNRIEVIPSGICLDKHKIEFTDEERREGRARYGFNDSHFVLINLGRLGTEKNLEEVITYFSRVCDKHDNARLLIVGGGPAKDELEALAVKLNLSERIVFAGMVEPNDVARYYRLGDLFVCASTSETQGLTYIEAAANGLPLLCRHDTCYDGVMIDGENGFRYNTFEEYSEHLDYIMAHPEWCDAAKGISLEVATHYDRPVFGEAVESLYKDAISTKSAE